MRLVRTLLLAAVLVAGHCSAQEQLRELAQISVTEDDVQPATPEFEGEALPEDLYDDECVASAAGGSAPAR
jgi:hypothetical protein